MFGTWFYHQRLRKSVAVFGTLFNNLYVLRKNSSGGTISQVKVPLSYAPSRKYLERIRENPNLSDNTKVALKNVKTVCTAIVLYSIVQYNVKLNDVQ